MPDPVRSLPTPPLPMLPMTGAPPRESPAPSSGTGATLSAIEALDADAAPAAGSALPGIAHDLVAAYQDGGAAEVLAFLRAHPDAVAALGLTDGEALEAALGRALERGPLGLRSILPDALRIATIDGAVRTYLDSAVRSRIFMQGESLVGAVHRDLDALENTLSSQLEELQAAAPDTPLGAVATSLGIRGDAGDLERARAILEGRRDEATELLEYLASPSLWETDELPVAGERAALTLGFAGAPPGSLGAEVVEGDGSPPPSRVAVNWAYQRLLQQGLMAVGIGSNPATAAALATSVMLSRFDELNADRHERILTYAHTLGL